MTRPVSYSPFGAVGERFVVVLGSPSGERDRGGGVLRLRGLLIMLVSARGDGSKGHAHEGAESDGDATEEARLPVTFLVRSAGTARRVRTAGCPRPYPRIWTRSASGGTGRKKKRKKGDVR